MPTRTLPGIEPPEAGLVILKIEFDRPKGLSVLPPPFSHIRSPSTANELPAILHSDGPSRQWLFTKESPNPRVFMIRTIPCS
jgi:hypothetical protein